MESMSFFSLSQLLKLVGLFRNTQKTMSSFPPGGKFCDLISKIRPLLNNILDQRTV